MNYMIKTVLFTVLTLSLFACSKRNEKATSINPVTGKHPSGWTTAGDGGLHPARYQAGPSACFECHGKNLNGGISGVSCFSASLSGINCHPAGPSGHPAGWSAPNAHGSSAKALAAGKDGIAHCQVCHGSDFAGGSAKKTCLNSAGCHGAGVMAPHSPKPWRSNIGGRTHTNSDASNATGCAVCHSAGANSIRKPSITPPVGTAPGCFNNTLCHGVEGHATGWKASFEHGAAAKSVSGGDNGFIACTQCHGAGYDGGSAEQSCLNTVGCHGTNVAAPHPASPWRSTSGGTSHVSSDVSNAGQCAVCHTGGANSSRGPRAGDKIGLTGCFNNTLCHAVTGHLDGWKAPNQHGTEAKKAPASDTGFSSCQPCHGAAFINGAAVTCFNNAACHGSGVYAPHSRKPWFSRIVGTPTHSSTDTANVGTCAICHTAGENSTVKPPFPATMTLAGCFNNTLCHFHQIPYAPSATIPPSLHGGEAKKDLTVCQACHGATGSTAFNGVTLADGTKTSACSSCHTFAKAHPTDWQGSGIYSHRTAGNRANACVLCHDVSQGRVSPLAAAPSCFSFSFSNGLSQTRSCHPSGPGVATHGVPYNNHNATARSNFSFCLGCHQIAANTTKPPGCQNCHMLDPQANPNNCISCHTNPPSGVTYPNSAGSHASHMALNVSNTCSECHSGLGLGTVDHLERSRLRSATVQANPVVFGTLAKTGGLSPSYSGACTNTYCHGSSLVGGINKAPQWGQTGYLQGCGTCHGFPPANSAHTGVTSATACVVCHTHVNLTNTGFTVPTKHINGVIDVTTGIAPHAVPYLSHTFTSTCLGCHQDAVTGASVVPPGCQNCHLTSPVTTQSGCTSCHASPPSGSSYPNITAVHGSHASSTKVATMTLACADCHTGLGVGTVDHQARSKARSATGRANPVAFGSGALLIAGGGTASTFNDTTGQCSNIYCHGAKMSGGDITGTNRTPVWSTTFLPGTMSVSACSTCHGFPPSTVSGHPAVTIPAGFPGTATIGTTCSCHSNINTVGDSYANIFVDKSKHINGLVEVSSVVVHSVPYLTHNATASTSCLSGAGGCHSLGTSASPYPAAAGTAPDCMSCHTLASPLIAGNGLGNCKSCHGSGGTSTAAAPTSTTWPNIRGSNSNARHPSHQGATCGTCHPNVTSTGRFTGTIAAGTVASGSGAGVNHGPNKTMTSGSSQINVIRTTTGIVPKTPRGSGATCTHGTIVVSGCHSGPGIKTW